MRIDSYNQIAQVYEVQKRVNARSRVSASSVSDQVSISQTGYDYQVARNAVSEASDIREDKVAQLKAMVASGNYQVDAGDFASKLLEKYNNTVMM